MVLEHRHNTLFNLAAVVAKPDGQKLLRIHEHASMDPYLVPTTFSHGGDFFCLLLDLLLSFKGDFLFLEICLLLLFVGQLL